MTKFVLNNNDNISIKLFLFLASENSYQLWALISLIFQSSQSANRLIKDYKHFEGYIINSEICIIIFD